MRERTMRFSISKTVRLGPVSLTFPKSGVNVSVGVPGTRVSVNTKGEGTIRVGSQGLRLS